MPFAYCPLPADRLDGPIERGRVKLGLKMEGSSASRWSLLLSSTMGAANTYYISPIVINKVLLMAAAAAAPAWLND